MKPTNQELIKRFNNGLSSDTAIESLKALIQLCENTPESVFVVDNYITLQYVMHTAKSDIEKYLMYRVYTLIRHLELHPLFGAMIEHFEQNAQHVRNSPVKDYIENMEKLQQQFKAGECKVKVD